MIILTAFVFVVFLYSMISARLERTVITAPIVFTAAGLLIYFARPVEAEAEAGQEVFKLLAELTLVLMLFTDATRISLRTLRGNGELPGRLLVIGLPLSIALGSLGAAIVLPSLSLVEAGILAAILAPTDASLGQIVVESPKVPVRIRQALNVESGLNDGGSVPFLMLFIALAEASAAGAGQILVQLLWQQIVIGALIGFLVSTVGGWLLDRAVQRNWMAERFQPYALLTLPLFCWLIAEPIGSSPFIAAFVAGLTVQIIFRHASDRILDFAEEEGQLLNIFVFFLFGLLVAPTLGRFSPTVLLYAAVSLTVVRLVPVAMALLGSGLNVITILFIGWFGPRGLASIVLGLVFLEQEVSLPGEGVIRLAITATVLISILAHGLSALPGIDWYARGIAGLAANAPELESVPELPTI